ncbi:CHAT domain-containing protein [Streptomyces davaonensis]|uniref:CHAT domain-containing protein n=1 Tax=Streptomyces davaonensis TaxID=348043 RepID=UPI00059F761D|nr:CHAT domain-containing protein [Streptomyces davaonensis]
MARQVANRSLSEQEALRRAREGARVAITPGALDDCFLGALQLLPRNPEIAYHWWQLILALVESRYGPGRRSAWWPAADRFVEITRLTLLDRPWGGRLRAALRTADLQTELLERALAEQSRPDRAMPARRSVATAAEREELTESRVAAAWLLAGPYCGKLDPEDIAGSFVRWSDPYSLNVKKVLAVSFADSAKAADADYGRWSLDPDQAMPEPGSALTDALARLDAALREAPPSLRGFCHLKRAQILPFLARLDPGREEEYWTAARDAVEHIGLTTNRPTSVGEYYETVAPVVRRYGASAPTRLKSLLTMSLPQLRRRVPGPELLRTLADVSVFVEDRRDLREIWEAVHALLAEHEVLPVAPWVWRDLAHRFPGNRLRCPSRPAGFDQLRSMAEALCRRAPSGERAATLAHAVLHAPDEDLGEAVEVLDGIAEVDRGFRRTHAWLLDSVAAGLRQRYAAWLRDQGRHREALLAGTLAAPDLVRLAMRHRSPGLVTGLVNDALESAEHTAHERSDHDALLLLMSVEPVVAGLVGAEDERSSFVRELGQEVVRLVLLAESASLSAAHQVLFKAYAFRLLMQAPGPRPATQRVRELNLRIAERESDEGPYVPDRLGPTGDSGTEPDGLSGLFFLTSMESAPDAGAEANCGHLRRVADVLLSADMIHGPHAPKYQEMYRPDLLEIGELSREGLGAETVFISLFLADRVQNHAGAYSSRTALVTAAVSGQDLALGAELLNVAGGLIRTHDPEENISHAWTWPAFDVAELREEINADPGGKPVTRHGATLLEQQFRLSGASADLLRQWRAEGRTHLCFWPHGPLHYLPFHLLHADGRPLADDWTVTTVATSAQCLPRPSGTASRGRRLLIAGSAAGGTRYGLREQPEIAAHVQKLTAQVRGARALRSGATTPTALMAAMTGVDFVHIAAHGSQDAEAPWYQCLYLDADDSGEGRLFAHQVLGLDLRGVDLVTLSACESALGRYDLNDNLRGLPAAFMLAGASTVIGVLWPVTAPVATLFYEDLYRCLLAEATKRDAFRHAQQTTRAAFPAYRDWGAFTLIGDWR